MHETVKRGRDRVGILVFVLLVLSHTQEFPHPPINTYFHKYMNKVFYAIYGDTLKKGEWTSNFQPIWKFWEKTPSLFFWRAFLAIMQLLLIVYYCSPFDFLVNSKNPPLFPIGWVLSYCMIFYGIYLSESFGYLLMCQTQFYQNFIKFFISIVFAFLGMEVCVVIEIIIIIFKKIIINLFNLVDFLCDGLINKSLR